MKRLYLKIVNIVLEGLVTTQVINDITMPGGLVGPRSIVSIVGIIYLRDRPEPQTGPGCSSLPSA